MRLESARALKAEILEQVTSAEASDLAAGGVWSMNARPTADVDPVARTVALGITRPTPGDYRLAIRVQRRGLENTQQVDAIRRKARGEVDFRYVGHVVKQAVPWEQTRKRPLLIGLSLGHYKITAGTLGAFVRLKSPIPFDAPDGKPVAQLLLAENCTVTIAHSKTKDLPAVVRRADLVIAAVGRAEMVKGDWLKPGACVIDVGINRIEREGKGKLVGDCDFASCEKVAGSITPVPGGVGPMTIACLLRNTVRAACAQKGIAIPEL